MAAQGQSARNNLMRFFSEMRRGARNQGNVIFALIFKEVKSSSGPDGMGLFSLVGVIIEPAIAVISMAVFFYFVRRAEIGGVHVALFLVVSYLPFGIIRRSMATVPKALKSNSAFYAYQQVKPFDSIVARFILEMSLIIIGGILVVFLLWWFLGLKPNFDRSPEVIGVFFMMILTGLGLSLFLGTYGVLYPSVQKTAVGMSRALYFLSAVIHPISEIHDTAGAFLLWNPIAHMEELLRYYALGMRPYADVTISYPFGFMLVMLFLGFAGYYANRLELLKR